MPRILLINNNSKFLADLVFLFPEADVLSFAEVTTKILNSYDGAVISGGRVFGPVVDMAPECKQEIALIKSSHKPILGICLGFQLICAAFGAELNWLAEKRIGLIEVEILEGDDSLLKGLPKFIQAYGSHRWRVGLLGEELVPLAYSVDGFEIVKHNMRPIYGCQFHPEKSDPLLMRRLVKNFIELCA